MLKFISKWLNNKLTRELWVKVYIEATKDGQDKDYCKLLADNAVTSYNNKFNELKIKLN